MKVDCVVFWTCDLYFSSPTVGMFHVRQETVLYESIWEPRFLHQKFTKIIAHPYSSHAKLEKWLMFAGLEKRTHTQHLGCAGCRTIIQAYHQNCDIPYIKQIQRKLHMLIPQLKQNIEHLIECGFIKTIGCQRMMLKWR
jgi:hypothetical protein